MRSSERRELTLREVLLAAAGALVLALVMNWPLPLHLGEAIPKDLGDPLPQSWKLAWAGHALTEQPLHFFQANQFYPERDSFAFGDMLLGWAPLGVFVDNPTEAVTRYDIVFLLAYAVTFFGAYLLARELGIGPAGSAVAGAAFAFAPFRLEHDGHMQVISTGGIPLAVALAIRGVRLRRPWTLFAAWLVAAWQVSIGFALGLPFIYLIAVAVAVAGVIWWRRGRPRIDRRMLAAGVAGGVLFLVIAGWVATPYYRIADAHPEAVRSTTDVEQFSDWPHMYLVAPEENSVWGGATSWIRDKVDPVPEKTLFPGLLTVLLAAVGLGSSSFPRWLRWALAGSVGVFSILALGFQEEGGILWPYRLLYEVLPGWDGIRTPGRLVTFSSLALALLAAGGTESVMRWVARRRERKGGEPGRSPAVLPAAVAAVLAFAVVVEGRGLPFDPFDDQAQPRVPDTPAQLAGVAAPQLHLPAERLEDNRLYLLWSTVGYPKIVNGAASTFPDSIRKEIEGMRGFPDEATVERLRELGVRSVVLHTNRVEGTPQAGADSASIEGLGLRRYELPGRVVFEIEPSEGSAE